MNTYDVARLGLVEIDGADVLGGETIAPLVAALLVASFTIVVGSVVANWSDFKDGIFEGFNSATH